MFHRGIAGALCLFLILPALIGESLEVTLAQKAKPQKSKKNKPIPAGHPVLWRQPQDISSRDLFLGPGGEQMKPDLRHVILIEKEKGGYSKKYRVRAKGSWTAATWNNGPKCSFRTVHSRGSESVIVIFYSFLLFR